MNILTLLFVHFGFFTVFYCALISIDGIYVQKSKTIPRIQCKVTGVAVSKIKWYVNNRELDENHAHFEIRSYNGSSGYHSNVSFYSVDANSLGGIYQCRVYSKTVLVYTGNLKLQASPHVDIQMDEETIYVNIGETVSLNCTVWGNPLPSLRWRTKKAPLKIQPVVMINSFYKSLTALVENFSDAKAGYYYCYGNNSFDRASKRVCLRSRSARNIAIPAIIFAMVSFITFVVASLSEALGVLANRIKIK